MDRTDTQPFTIEAVTMLCLYLKLKKILNLTRQYHAAAAINPTEDSRGEEILGCHLYFLLFKNK